MEEPKIRIGSDSKNLLFIFPSQVQFPDVFQEREDNL